MQGDFQMTVTRALKFMREIITILLSIIIFLALKEQLKIKNYMYIFMLSKTLKILFELKAI